MSLIPGTRLGPYEIITPLGAGGMGEVYRARDTRLERPVAIKILPLHLAERPLARERFEREARSISSLNHPHICQLYDVGQQEGVSYLVMELLEGETLAYRLIRGALPLEQVLKYGAEIAEGLEKAHRCGVVHRDLKPGNIMLTKSGAKLMDFGLAKEINIGFPTSSDTDVTINVATPQPVQEGTRSRRNTSPLTGEGVIVGTFQYMSPEQIEGREADSRSDIFSLGVVLYEMTTGKRAFEGKTTASVIAAILASEPKPVSAIQPLAPPALEHVIKLCLAKDPDDRWQSAIDLHRELKWIQEAGSQAGTSSPVAAARRRRVRLTWTFVVGLALMVGILAGLALRPRRKLPSLTVALNLPAGFRIDVLDSSLALSPDGQKLAFAAAGPDGVQRLWLRSLNGQDPQALSGTEEAIYPFWSPDAKFIGFFSKKKLRKIEVATGTVQALCDAPAARGGAWNQHGDIVFAPDYQTGLYQVSASGGTAVEVTNGGKKFSHRLPHFLPDGKHLLFFSGWETNGKENGIYSLDIESRKFKKVASEQSEGIYVAPGYLAFLRDGNLMAQPFDAGTQQTSGEAMLVAESVVHNLDRYTGEFTFSANGLLLYQTGPSAAKSQLTLYDGEGGRLGVIGEAKTFQPEVMLSPDDRRVAVATRDTDGHGVIWVHDLSTGVGTRLTFGNLSFYNPAWSSDSKQLAFSSDDGDIYIQQADGSSPARTVLKEATPKSTNSWSPDGKFLAFQQQLDKGPDIWLLPLEGDRKPQPYISTPTWEAEGTFSPNGKWFAYTSDETGRYEVYVVPFPGTGGKLQVSSGGGQMPEWVMGGRALAYINDTHNLVLVDMIDKQPQMEIGRPRLLFGGHPLPVLPGFDASGEGGTPVYLTQDGKRLLLAIPTDFGSITALTLVTDWTAAFTK